MAALTLTLSPTNPTVGQTVTATYALTGADDVPASTRSFPVGGAVELDGSPLTVSVTLSVTTPAVTHTRVFQAPTAPGLTFTATSDPKVWTATAS